MTTTYNPDEIAQLCREAEDLDDCDLVERAPGDYTCHVRTRLRAMADQLEAAWALIERLAHDLDLRTKERDAKSESMGELCAEVDRVQGHFNEMCSTIERLTANVDRLIAEHDKLRLQLEARDAIIAAGQRTIDSGNEAFRTLREQWHAERDRLRAELEAARREVERLTTERDNARWADETRKKAAAVIIAERDRMRPVVEAAERLEPNWRDTSGSMVSLDAVNDACEAIATAVDAYRAARDKAERCDSCDWTFPCFAEPARCIKRPLINTSDGVFDPESSLEVFDRRRR